MASLRKLFLILVVPLGTVSAKGRGGGGGSSGRQIIPLPCNYTQADFLQVCFSMQRQLLKIAEVTDS